MIAREARLMLRAHRYGALGTLSKKFHGYPFGSITPYLADHDGSLLILISSLAEHTKNILHDPRASLITHDQRDPHIQSQGRVTVIGNAEPEQKREQAGLRYLRYFPEAADLLRHARFFLLSASHPLPSDISAVSGKIHWINMDNYAVAHAGIFAQQEESLLAEINAKRRISCGNCCETDGIEVSRCRLSGWIATDWMCAATNRSGGWIFPKRQPARHSMRWAI